MNKLPNYRRISFDAEKFYEAIRKKHLKMIDLAKKIGVSQDYIRKARREGKINPAALVEAKKYIDFDMDEVCPNLEFVRMYNGRGTKSGRMRVDWDTLKEVAKQEGYSYEELSELLGHGPAYLATSKATGGLSADIINRLAEILSVQPEILTDYIEPHAANIIYLINSQHYE